MSSAATLSFPEEQDERYYRIGEVSRLTGIPAFVLRYWEIELPMLQPAKSPQGYRLYRQQDVDLVLKIKRLLHDEGFTIAGARRLLSEPEAPAAAMEVAPEPAVIRRPEVQPETASGGGQQMAPIDRQALLELRDALRSFLTALERK